METFYYETIEIETICKNGSEKHGANAKTTTSLSKDGTALKMEVSQYGKTKEEAKQKLIDFITGKGKYITECVGKF